MKKIFLSVFLIIVFLTLVFAQNRYIRNDEIERVVGQKDSNVFYSIVHVPYLKTINSILPNRLGNFKLVAGENITITPDKLNNQIFIDANVSGGGLTEEDVNNLININSVTGVFEGQNIDVNSQKGDVQVSLDTTNICLLDAINVFTQENRFTYGGSKFIYIDAANREIEFDGTGQAKIKTSADSIQYSAGSGSPFHEFLGLLRPTSTNQWDLGVNITNEWRNIYSGGISYLTDVNSLDVNSNTYCLQGDCITSWPAGGGGDVNGTDINPNFITISTDLNVGRDANIMRDLNVNRTLRTLDLNVTRDANINGKLIVIDVNVVRDLNVTKNIRTDGNIFIQKTGSGLCLNLSCTKRIWVDSLGNVVIDS